MSGGRRGARRQVKHVNQTIRALSGRFCESPVFGLAGIILPENAVRPFATWFLQLKQYIFNAEIAASGKSASHWEKHGTAIFTAKQLARYPHFRSTGFRLLNYIRDRGGNVFYYGREKISGTTEVNSTGLYTTILAHAIRQLDRCCAENAPFNRYFWNRLHQVATYSTVLPR